VSLASGVRPCRRLGLVAVQRCRKLVCLSRVSGRQVSDVGESPMTSNTASEPSSDATVEKWNRREPLGDLGVLCVMHGPSHAKVAKVAKKDRFPVASELVSDVHIISRSSWVWGRSSTPHEKPAGALW
jgi:hypothetical protein